MTGAADGAGAGDIPAAADGAGGILVVGYGNVLCSDDGVGPAVAAAVALDPRLAGCDVRALHQLTPELALDVSRVSLVVLVDADAGIDPGSVVARRVDEDPVEPASAWSHQLGPGSLAPLARELWGQAPPVFAVGVGPASIDVGERLSTVVESAVPRAVDAVAAIVADHRHA